MPNSGWYAFEEGETLGQVGSEAGLIVSDEEHVLGARITLERETRMAPFAITCGVYGAMLHTRFLGDEAEARAEYEAMKEALAALVEMVDDASEAGRQAFAAGATDFVARFP